MKTTILKQSLLLLSSATLLAACFGALSFSLFFLLVATPHCL